MSKSTDLSISKVLKENRRLFETAVSLGDCRSCPLKDTCQFFDDSSLSCGMIDEAVSEFYQFAAQTAPSLQKSDVMLLRTAGSLHATIVLCEEYFRRFGSVETGRNGAFRLNTMFSQYQKTLKQYQSLLSELGLTPTSRQKLTERLRKDDGLRAFENYVETKVIDAESEPESSGSDQHHSVLRGQEASEPGTETRPESPPEADLQDPPD